MNLFNGRPETAEGRTPQELAVYDLLDRLEIPYQRTDHEPAETMEACRQIDEILQVKMCKNLFLCNRQKTKYYLLLMPADKPFKTKELSAQINSARLSFAGEDAMWSLLGVHPGAVTVLGLMNDKEDMVQLLVDEDILKDEFIGCHPCVNTSSLKISSDDIFKKFLGEVHYRFITVHLTGQA